jgi:hypothetical protein
VAAFIEMKIRKELKRTKQQLEVPGKRMTDRPTIQSILDLLANIQVLKVDTGTDIVRILPKNTDKRALHVLKLAGYDVTFFFAQYLVFLV